MESIRGLELSGSPPQQAGGHVAEARDWAQLQQDLLTRIFSQLELPDLACSGAACTSWHLAYAAVRRFKLCSPGRQSPYLVYSSKDRDVSTAALHSVSTDRVYHVPLPDPPFRSRYVVGSSHGWLVTADEQSDLHLLNPVTGTQIALPPAHAVEGVELSFEEDGTACGHRAIT
ncbi:hypothetical protein BAE44_0022184 [Dichanthelium oligosanthes]|uniref:KIB1-4 beta-propeller domain-containing protein n=1 Tax=Dichanthelium oligosanthes TaxID=888268 RepID=A0A1E5UVF8_9POAL|nr:hypothetical protein BAE44_0022184 [Dichanthelium oligosanthes]